MPRLYSLYLGFIQLHKRFEVLAREIDTAKRDGRQLEDLPPHKESSAARIKCEIDRDMQFVRANAEIVELGP